ncbi:MAG: hypothetical protein NDJ90_01060 [Oligoflexia bacterium]|nr:hypothetical protein [Oligoflexia bacterium]
MRNLSILALLFASLPVFAGDLEEAFSALRDSAIDYENTGAVCEQIARLDLAKHYPAPTYESVTGIVYQNLERSIGELDVVIFDKRTDQAVLVAEVKCWRNLQSARQKARKQRDRFLSAIENVPEELTFYSMSQRKQEFRAEQFSSRLRFISISQQGGSQVGFDDELDFTLEELMRLRTRLMECQASGECRSPDLES